MKVSAIDQIEIVRLITAKGASITKFVTGDSMEPAIPDGVVLHLCPVQDRQIRLGDVVFIVSPQGKPIIHRVAWLYRKHGKDFCQTWGDNQLTPDLPVSCEEVLARVTAFRLDGRICPLPHPVLAYIPLFLRRYFWYYLHYLWRKYTRRFR